MFYAASFKVNALGEFTLWVLVFSSHYYLVIMSLPIDLTTTIFMDFFIGAKVYISSPLTYLKTNDPMPMLRPPDLVSMDELGEVVGIRAKDTAEVSFRRGTFLISFEKLSLATTIKDN